MERYFAFNPLAEIHVPDGSDPVEAIRRTTHLAIAAHQDDVEIMAQHGILACYRRPDLHFTAVIVTDGSGSPRAGRFAGTTDEEMMQIRRDEQKRAADIGAYSAVVFLNHPSAAVKAANGDAAAVLMTDLVNLAAQARADVLYTHQPTDRHATHVAICARVVAALRQLPVNRRPALVYGCEVWRSLDWVDERDRVTLDVSGHDELRQQLLAAFESQIAGGKRYDLATFGRQAANATFAASHAVDRREAATYALDLAPVVESGDLEAFVDHLLKRFGDEVRSVLKTVMP